MNFPTYQPALVTWVKALTGLAVVQFENEPRVQHDGRLGLLSWVSARGVGTDEVRIDVDSGAAKPSPNLTPVQLGQRSLTLQISIEVHDQRATAHARMLLEQLRDRVRWPSSMKTLRTANLGLANVGTVTPADYRVSAPVPRWISRCLLEVTFNATTEEVDTAGKFPSIETVEVTSHIKNPAGVEVAPSLQLIAEEMP